MAAARRKSSAKARVPEFTPADAARRLGIEQLRPEQERVIADVTAGRDVLMILPTGFGKSACYQIPSLLLPKPVLVISPLLALLRDQHEKLLAREIPCVRIDGTVRGRARAQALQRIETGGPLLVLTTPETLEASTLREPLGKSGLSLAAVDEAHCISEWGYDFRPAYSRLGAGLRALQAPAILALTATATEHVRSAIVRSLGLRDPVVVASSPHRSNLAFEVLPCGGDSRLRAALRLVQRLRRPGIVYCSTQREVELVHAVIRRFGVPAHRYHGGMGSAERTAEQEAFMRPNRRTVMVATSAFGLGIDKSDIRYVVHFQSPASLEQYVQEAGRAGRDGLRANCILLHDPEDRTIHEALLSRSRVRPDQLYKLGHALAAWFDEGRHPSLEALALSAELGPRVAAALLARLEEAGLVERDDSEIRPTGDGAGIDDRARQLAGQFETLRTQDSRRLDTIGEYAAAPGCRAAFLRGYFGEEEGEPCGLCDTCQARPARSDGFFAPLAPSKRAQPGKRGSRRRPQPGDPSRRARPQQPAKEEGAGRGRRRRRPRGGRSRPEALPSADAQRILANALRLSDDEPQSAAAAPRVEAPRGEDARRRRRGGRRGRRGGRRRRGRSGEDGPSAPDATPVD
jgi:ATP-dependent DNA helicase RecQ